MEQISGCQAVERAITILELFDEHRTVVGVGDAAKALGVHRSTASRLMATLERRGLLEQAEGSASYRLGLGLVPLAGFVLNRFPVRAQAGQGAARAARRHRRDGLAGRARRAQDHLPRPGLQPPRHRQRRLGRRPPRADGGRHRPAAAGIPTRRYDRPARGRGARRRAGPVRHRAGTGAPAGSRHPHQRGRGRLLWRRGADPRRRRHGGCRDRPRRPAVPRLRAEASPTSCCRRHQRRCARAEALGDRALDGQPPTRSTRSRCCPGSPSACGRGRPAARRGHAPARLAAGQLLASVTVAVALAAPRRCRRQDGGQRP